MMNFYRPSREEVEELRNRFPVGARVELDYMSDPYNRTLHTGSQGTVRRVDDMGTVHVNWDCGSCLGLAYPDDSFHLVTENYG